MPYTTRKSLLDGIQNGDQVSWEDFYQTYRPLIILCGKDFNLSAADLEELCQIVLIDIFKNSKTFRYDRKLGRFRDYLRQIIRHNALDLLRKNKNSQLVSDETADCADPNQEKHWEENWQAHLLEQAQAMLRAQLEPTTYQAFELYALQDQPVQQVAAFLHLSVNSVYVAKTRALDKLRENVRILQKE